MFSRYEDIRVFTKINPILLNTEFYTARNGMTNFESKYQSIPGIKNYIQIRKIERVRKC